MTHYSKQTRLSVNMAEVGAYSFSKLEKTVEDNLISLISRTEISRNYSTMKAALDYIPGMKQFLGVHGVYNINFSACHTCMYKRKKICIVIFVVLVQYNLWQFIKKVTKQIKRNTFILLTGCRIMKISKLKCSISL